MTADHPRLIRAKLVLLGAPAVGKTSLVRRFVHSVFSDGYQSTIGVKVDRKSVDLPHATVAMLLWDLHGETEGLQVPTSYMRGAASALAVFDASRPETAEKAAELSGRFLEASPAGTVYPVSNKSDLDVDWEQVETAAREAGLESPMRVSAKDGDGVEDLFVTVATNLADT